MKFDESHAKPGHLHRLRLNTPQGSSAAAPVWLHMCIHHEETSQFLMEDEALDDIIVSAMVAMETRSRILARPNGVMVLIKAMHLREGARPEHFAAVRLWVDAKRIVSTREEDIDAVVEMRERIEAGGGPATTGAFLVELIGSIYADIEPYIDEMEDQLGDFDERIAAHDAGDVLCDKLGGVRRRIAAFLHHLSPQKTVLETLMASKCSLLSEDDHHMLVEHHDTLVRFAETLGELRERTRILDDQVNRIQAGRIERISFLFAVVAAIFLPITFLTGLFGVNLGGIPMAESPYSFAGFAALCVAIIGFIVFAFRKRGLL